MNWISVKDRMPDIKHISEHYRSSDDVLCYNSTYDICFVARWSEIEFGRENFWNPNGPSQGRLHFGNKITHWMELPELPEQPNGADDYIKSVEDSLRKKIGDLINKCIINKSTKENGFDVWCCEIHAQEYCDNKNNKYRKISKNDFVVQDRNKKVRTNIDKLQKQLADSYFSGPVNQE